MNLNVLGGACAVVALIAIFAYGQKPPKPHLSAPPAASAPAPAKPSPKVSAAPLSPETKYYRVEHDGKQGPEVNCRAVKSFADGKSPAELASLAKQYGVSVAELKRYYVCEN